MLKLLISLSFLFISVNLIVGKESVNDQDLDKLLLELSEKINSYQVLEDQHYKPPFKWEERKGLFRSDIRINLVGNPVFTFLRNSELTAIFDNDMFSTGWVLTALLEAGLYGRGAPVFDPERLQLALETIDSYNNKNDENYEKTLLRTFWPQNLNQTDGSWFQQPINIRNVALNIDKIPFDLIEKILKAVKLDKLIPFIDGIKELGQESIKAFCIPPDFDDTYLNLGLGATLYKMKDQYPGAYKSWSVNNTLVQHLADVTSQYAYRPFDRDTNKNVIDPRTFFFARHFVQQAFDENKPLSLITTWIQNIEEQKTLKDKSISMPFNLNNVDVTVAANSIYGITSGSIYNVNGFGDLFLDDEDLQQVYLNSTKFISWAIKSNFSSRPDLALVYYPSEFNFYWYASRTLFLIENEYQRYMYVRTDPNERDFVNRFEKLFDIIMEARTYLEEAFQTAATQFLLEKALRPKFSSDDEFYYIDFLGANDKDIFGKEIKSNDDALFSTAQAANIIISTWTYQKPDTLRLTWRDSAPETVKNLLGSIVNWLKKNVFKYKPLNAFFSGSVKGFTSLPFWYPSNYIQFLNGTTVVDPASLSREDLESIVNGVQGSIDEKTYQDELTKTHFGYPTPIDFDGYNVKNNIFPFWSSAPYTYAVSLLALSQFNNLE